VLAADKGYDSKQKRADLRKRGIRPQIPKRVWKSKKNKGRPSKFLFLDFSKSDVLLGISANTAILSSDGNIKKFTLTHSLTLLQYTSGLIKYY